MQYDFLFEVNDGVATLTFNRPEVMNALTFEVYAQLRDLFESLRYDDDVRVVVLTGAGDNFCSGGDVYEIIGELQTRHEGPPGIYAHDRGGGQKYAGAGQADYCRAQWYDRRGRGRHRAGLRPAHRLGKGAHRLPLHESRPDRCGYGRGLPATEGCWHRTRL